MYRAYGIAGYNYRSQHCHGGCIFLCGDQPRERLRCSQCGSENVWIRGKKERMFHTLPIGGKPTSIVLDVPRRPGVVATYGHPECCRASQNPLGHHQGDSVQVPPPLLRKSETEQAQADRHR
ncbi:MAG: transposase family protein [Gemmataceae bacterium]|nr:transposase family protein [Gemmataceae bacterium]